MSVFRLSQSPITIAPGSRTKSINANAEILETAHAVTTAFFTTTMAISKSFNERRGEKEIVKKYQLNENGPHD